MNNQPIGIFDSGIGGLTVANAILRHLPNERIVYFGDTAHLPYGDKSSEAIRGYCSRITEFLLDKECKLVVMACNSASSAAYLQLVRDFSGLVPIANVIDPVVEAIAARKDINKIGVIGTKATIRNGVYNRKLKKLRPDLVVKNQATPLLAQMIEEGFFNNNISRAVISSYLEKSHFEGIQGLILACTHYSLIKEDIEKLYKGNIEIFNTLDIVAENISNVLARREILSTEKTAENQFYVSDYTESFEETTKVFWGETIKLQLADIWK
ncbi:MAG: glutamate racemase [Limisphaerales bacterium]|jgi:glutamate racemase